MFSSKAFRSWLASLIFLSLIIGLIFFFTLMEIPKSNKDIITAVVGMLVGSMSMAISIFVGRDPDDVAELKADIDALKDDRNTLIARLRDAYLIQERLRKQHEHLQTQVIDKLSIFVGRESLEAIGRVEIPPELEEWMPSPDQVTPSINPRDFEDFDPNNKS